MTAEPREMVCPACGASWFSAAAAELVASGYRCLRCDTPLELASDEGAGADGENG